ncbi:uncharacterized protein LOC135953773 [Calliphora vicina]|uniref:uncharacterized protein LOC135953773 n=1 Tax=Calliphora vicina TaxID=7373 RepID=UPI00325AFEFB
MVQRGVVALDLHAKLHQVPVNNISRIYYKHYPHPRDNMYLKMRYLVLLNLIVLTHGDFKLTNLKCIEFDKPFATIPICILKVVQRGVVGLDLHVKLHQIPVNNVSVNIALSKRASGYKPFLYNVSADFCKLMKNGQKKFPFIYWFTTLLGKQSNINHTCPYNHDIIVRRLILKEEMFKILPLPQGDYLFDVKVGAYNNWKALIKAYFTTTN